MGIYDRDYARAPGPGNMGASRPAWSKLRGLSFIHWLIIINIAVFVGDALMGARGVLFAVQVGEQIDPGIDITNRTLVFQAPQSRPTRQTNLRATMVAPIVDQATGETVGRKVYTWMPPIAAAGHFSTARGFLKLEVWRLITFQFLHADISHLAFNMIALWFFGPLVEYALRSRKRTAAYYLVCGIAGALVFLTLNLLGYLGARFHGSLNVDIFTPLIGASAGVFGVLMAAAKIAGDEIMLLFLVIPVKVRTGAYLMFLAALANLIFAGQNAGGDAAHVGGAIAGFFFIRNMHLLRDFFEVLGPSRRVKRGIARGAPVAETNQARVDAILDKVKARGVHSLTRSEQDTLRRATERERDRS